MSDSDTSAGDVFQTLRRFYGFAAPHWKMILGAFVSMVFCALLWGGMLLLVKPLTEGVIAEEAAQQESAQTQQQQEETTSPSGQQGEPDSAGPANKIEEIKTEAKNWFLELYPVRAVVNYLRPGPDTMQRVGIVVLVGIAPLLMAASFFQRYFREKVTWRVMADLRIAVFEKMSGLPLSFFSGRRAGDLISRLTNDINISRKAVKKIFGDLIRSPIRLLVFTAAALYASVKLFLLAIVAFPLLAFVLRSFGGRIRKYSRKMLERLGDLTEAISQMFTGIRVIKAFGMEEEENRRFREKTQHQLRRAYKLVRVRAWANGLPRFVSALGIGGVLLFANYLFQTDQLDPGSLALFTLALVAMSGPVRRIVKSYNILQQSLGAVDRVFELLDAEEAVEDPPDAVELNGVQESIDFENVWFAYDGSEHVLEDINLHVPAGSVCAIVGETGAGKSTLLDLLPRFYEPQTGTIRIDGTDIRHIKRESLMANIAIVGQQPFLFNRSIADNIRYGKPDATDEEVKEAARAASVHEFVQSLPEGYETEVGERGGRLSGGQRQCVTMARAILKDSPIMILDEATSDLDSESERAVQRALENLTVDRTTFIIAHRLSTVQHADMIVVMKDGRIIETGTHDDLVELGGEYEKLYRLQFLEPSTTG